MGGSGTRALSVGACDWCARTIPAGEWLWQVVARGCRVTSEGIDWNGASDMALVCKDCWNELKERGMRGMEERDE